MRHRKLSYKHNKRKTFSKTFNTNKYMKNIKGGLENVGQHVIKTGQTSVPLLQQFTRRIITFFSKAFNTRKRR